MSLNKDERAKKQDLIDKFNERVKDWVSSNTQWIASTPVWDTTVGAVVANSVSNGGLLNRTVSATIAPELIDPTEIIDRVTAVGTKAGSIVQILRDLSTIYANTHMITLINTGNIGDASYLGVAQLDGAPSAYVTQVHDEVDAQATKNKVISGEKLNATNILNFIEGCRTVWTNRCINSSIEEFKYGYCHSSCHSNVTCYNSRGRR